MTTVFTAYLPLTTTFTAPAECTNGPWIYKNVPTTWWKAGGDNVPSCFPPAFPFSKSSIVYSPGICPAGWTSACERAITRSGSVQAITSCCPASYECAFTSRDLHDWEDQLGCASSYSVNTTAWGMSSDAPFVSSIYQLQVMIVEAATTTTSIEATPGMSTTPSYLSTSSTTSTLPSATAPSTSTPPPAKSERLSGGIIAGIVIGATIALAITAFLAYMAWVIRNRNRASTHEGQPLNHQSEWSGIARDNLEAHYNTPARAELDDGHQVHELKAP